MANILYIHGYGSNSNSTSLQKIREAFPQHNFFSADFDLLNPSDTLEKIDEICKNQDIHLIIGKSLGGFYTMVYEGEQDKMFINPCLKPWIEVPKINSAVPEEVLSTWKELFDNAEQNIHGAQRAQSFGIFGDSDPHFSFKDYFDQKYNDYSAGLQKSYLVPGSHELSEEVLLKAVRRGFQYFDMLEEYNYVVTLMPFYQLIKDPDDDFDLGLSQKDKEKIISSVNHYHNRMVFYQAEKIFE